MHRRQQSWGYRRRRTALRILFGFAAGCAFADAANPIMVDAAIPGMDPSLVRERPMTRNTAGEYSMEVESVACLDGQCKVQAVRLYWDELGRYRRYELAPGTVLEKTEGKPFTDEDYAKLHDILSDSASPLADVDIKTMMGKPAADDGVDVMSGATATVPDSAVVKGASWTCHTLWHWAHGAPSKIIRRTTGRSMSLDDLHQVLAEGSAEYRLLALEELNLRRSYDDATAQRVATLAPTADMDAAGPLIEYAFHAPADRQSPIAESLFHSGSALLRACILDQLKRNPAPLDEEFAEWLSRELAGMQSYMEVDSILELLGTRQPVPAPILHRAAILLDRDDFLSARRAYWFLQAQTLPYNLEEQVKAFHDQHPGL